MDHEQIRESAQSPWSAEAQQYFDDDRFRVDIVAAFVTPLSAAEYAKRRPEYERQQTDERARAVEAERTREVPVEAFPRTIVGKWEYVVPEDPGPGALLTIESWTMNFRDNGHFVRTSPSP